MREQTMKNTMKTVSASVLAALLLVTPPAGATTKKTPAKASPKANPEAQKLMSEGLGDLQRGDYSDAVAVLDKAAHKQGSVSTYFLLGWAYYQRGFKQGSIVNADRGDAKSAIAAYRKAIVIDPKLKALPDASRLYFSMGMCEEAVESYDRALASYQSALRLSPNKAMIPLNAARLRLKMKDDVKARSNLAMALDMARKSGDSAALAAALQNDPSYEPLRSHPAVLRLLGAAAPTMVAAKNDNVEELRDSVNDAPSHPVVAPPALDPRVLAQIESGNLEFSFRRFQNAAIAYNAAVKINEKRGTLSADQVAGLYEKIGTCYNKLGSGEKAMVSLQKSLQLSPSNASAHYQIALAYAMDGKTGSALHALKECFTSTGDPAELRRFSILAKTDSELEAVRDLPGFKQIMADVAGHDRVALR
ncbi:MAG: tetratricopeptide repeat protein [Elusimicrobiota bacterium]